MKKTLRFSFLFACIVMSPLMATATEICYADPTNTSQCSVGCWSDTDSEDSACEVCAANRYNDGTTASCTGCTPPQFVGEGRQHTDGEWCASCQHWMCASGYFANGNNNISTLRENGDCDTPQDGDCINCPYNTPNNSYDLWYAESVHGLFLASNFSACITDQYPTLCGSSKDLIKSEPGDDIIYYCGSCGHGTVLSIDSTTNAQTCNCYTHANRIGGHGFVDDVWAECKCPGDLHPINGDCKCDDNMVMVQDSGTHEWRCEPCPDNSEVLGTTCICKQNFYNQNSDPDVAPSCVRCPNGTFKESGNAGITECQMNHDTKFCDRNGQSCMQLIPES